MVILLEAISTNVSNCKKTNPDKTSWKNVLMLVDWESPKLTWMQLKYMSALTSSSPSDCVTWAATDKTCDNGQYFYADREAAPLKLLWIQMTCDWSQAHSQSIIGLSNLGTWTRWHFRGHFRVFRQPPWDLNHIHCIAVYCCYQLDHEI